MMLWGNSRPAKDGHGDRWDQGRINNSLRIGRLVIGLVLISFLTSIIESVCHLFLEKLPTRCTWCLIS